MSELVLDEYPLPTVCRLVLNRPERRNALDDELRASLLEKLVRVTSDVEVRAVILAGAGSSFCAGGDVRGTVGLDAPRGRMRMDSHHQLVRLLAHADKPVVAEVAGWASGAGVGLALLCDTIVAAKSARFGFPFLRVGLVPDYAVTLTLARRIGVGRARQLLLYAKNVSADEAFQIGLADDVVNDELLSSTALDRAAQLAGQPPYALGLAKRLVSHAASQIEPLLELEQMAQNLCYLTDESAEGRTAFLEKRDPQF